MEKIVYFNYCTIQRLLVLSLVRVTLLYDTICTLQQQLKSRQPMRRSFCKRRTKERDLLRWMMNLYEIIAHPPTSFGPFIMLLMPLFFGYFFLKGTSSFNHYAPQTKVYYVQRENLIKCAERNSVDCYHFVGE